MKTQLVRSKSLQTTGVFLAKFGPSKPGTPGICELSRKAVDIWAGAYGSEAGVVALTYMPFGGRRLSQSKTSQTGQKLSTRPRLIPHRWCHLKNEGVGPAETVAVQFVSEEAKIKPEIWCYMMSYGPKMR